MKWEPIKPMMTGRSYSSVTAVNGYICVAGGQKDNASMKSVELYDPKSDEWVQLADMNKSRLAFALMDSNRFVYAIDCFRGIERYDPWKTCWTLVRKFSSVNIPNI